MKNLAWIDGTICDINEAKVPIEDRGYLFGDGVYDVVKIYNGRPFYLQAHLERLQRSANAIEIEIPYALPEIEKSIESLMKQSNCTDGYLYMQVTRGSAPRGHLFPLGNSPTMIMYVRSYEGSLHSEQIESADCITLPDERWLNCYIKSINLLPNVYALQKAYEAGAAEAILYRSDGTVTEGTHTNVFAVIDGTVRTHPQSKLILTGITRNIVLDLLSQLEVPVLEKAFSVDDLKHASEVWTTSTGLEIMPVSRIDGRAVKEFSTGPICKSLIDEFRKKVQAECYAGGS